MDKNSTKRHPIQVVSHRTGLSPDLLRTWERRYGVVRPGRTRGGHRLYSDSDIDRLRLVRQAIEPGRPIGLVAGLSRPELEEMVQEDHLAEPGTDQAGDGSLPPSSLFEAVEALEQIDAEALIRSLSTAAARSPGRVAREILVPLLQHLGRLWAGEPHPGRQLEIRLRPVGADETPAAGVAARLVVAAPARMGSELAAQMVVLTGARRGWQVVHLGLGVTASRIAQAAEGARAVALILDRVGPGSDAIVVVRELTTTLGGDAELLAVVGGDRAGRAGHLAGTTTVGSLEELESRLDHIRQRPTGPTIRDLATSGGESP